MSEWPPAVGTDPDPQKPRVSEVIVGMTGKVADAISFDKLLVSGLLGCLAVILVASAILGWKGGEQPLGLVLGFYKDLALILAGALANSVRHSQKERKDDQGQ